MKHIPILFSTEMVRAKLDGRKKMTRRTKGLEVINANPEEYRLTYKHKNICRFFSGEENNPNPVEKYWIFEHISDGEEIEVKCPYGVVRDIKEKSDILWVRESFAASPFDDNVFVYKADAYEHINTPNKHKWKPSIHMPKDACRIFLRVTDVRIERLQDISEQDAVDEGIKMDDEPTICYKNYMSDKWWYSNPIDSFRSLWVSINGQKSWVDNPFVWVVSFERCERPADFLNH